MLEHTHVVIPSKAITCHKKLNAHVKRMLQVPEEASVHLSKNYKVLAIEEDGNENPPFSEKYF